MTGVLSVFVSAVLPVLSVVAVGYLLRLSRPIDVGPLNTVTLYVLLPALVLYSLLSSDLGGDLPRLVLAIVVFTAVLFAIAIGAGRVLGESGSRLSALAFVAALPNVGNFGIPVATFAFGSAGGTVAIVFTVTQSVITYTLGVYVAARGAGGEWQSHVGRVVRLPLVYVVALALLLRAVGVVPPAGGTTMETLELVGNASIPVFLIVLGVQLAETDPESAIRETTPAIGLRFLVAPAVAILTATLVGFQTPVVSRSFVLLTAAPAAVTPLVLLIEFGSGDVRASPTGPEYHGTAVFVSTLLSIPVVTGLIVVLRSGALF